MAGLLVYGANGYTGELIAREAARRGHEMILAGRREAAVRALADELGCSARIFALDDPEAVDRGLEGADVLLGCAGPFGATWRPLVDACIRQRVHYLDITGEIAVFAGIHSRNTQAREAGVMLLPGAGFDVVPSDCLATETVSRLSAPVKLQLAFAAAGGVSRGTATTAVRRLGEGGAIRRDGQVVEVPAAYRTMQVEITRGVPETVVSIPWGDVYTAGVSTGVPNVETYLGLGLPARAFLRASRTLRGLLRTRAVRGVMTRLVRSGRPGPSAAQREAGETRLWARAEAEDGSSVELRLRGPEGYTFTVHAALACAERALSGDAPPGYQTPSMAYGAELVLGLPGVSGWEE